MNKTSIAKQIKNARKRRDLKQTILSARTGVSADRISHFETGRRIPVKEEWNALRTELELCCWERSGAVGLPVADKAWHVAARLPIPTHDAPLAARVYAAQKKFGSIVNEHISRIESRDDLAECEVFLHRARLDSSHEALFWLALLAAGAKPCRFAPALAGYRNFRLVDSDCKRNISDLRHPCLDLLLKGGQLLLFPQVTIDTGSYCYRLDGLACYRKGKQRIWLNIEVDGFGHDPDFDEERQRRLGLVTLRLGTQDLQSGNLPELLERRVIGLTETPLAS